MGINLSNPKTFLPLLLFIGLIFSLIGLGWWGFREDSSIFLLGLGIITLSVVLWIYEKEKE